MARAGPSTRTEGASHGETETCTSPQAGGANAPRREEASGRCQAPAHGQEAGVDPRQDRPPPGPAAEVARGRQTGRNQTGRADAQEAWRPIGGNHSEQARSQLVYKEGLALSFSR